MIPTDLWHVAVVKAPLARIIAAGTLDGLDAVWLPVPESLHFLADPFGLWKDDRLYIFVETYDYRSHRGEIEVLIFDEGLALQQRGVVLREPWHLSYPFVFQAEGALWMLPEAYKSGHLSLYRASDFPWRWKREARFSFPEAAIDPVVVQAGNGWWMLYTPAIPREGRRSTLKLAHADHLFGPWEGCDAPPILVDPAGSRMGGTPIHEGDAWLLPTQDCGRTYGGAISIKCIADPIGRSSPITAGPHITAPGSFQPYVDGLHTLSAIGPWTLVDAKRVIHSWRRLGVEARRHLTSHGKG